MNKAHLAACLLTALLCFAFPGFLGSWHVSPALQLGNRNSDSLWEMQLQYRHGHVGEYVLYQDYVLSRLDWDIRHITPAFSWTGRLDRETSLGLGLMFSIAQKSGGMEDRDWSSTDSEGYLLMDGELSHFSAHDNYLQYLFTLDANLSRNFFQENAVNVAIQVGLQVDYWKYDARDGYYEYPPGSDPVSLSGSSITYQVFRSMLYLGGIIKYDGIARWPISLQLAASPLVFDYAVDNHLLRSLKFTDIIFPAWYFSLNVQIHWLVEKDWALGLSIGYQKFPLGSGKSLVQDTITGENFEQQTEGGLESNAWEFGISISWL